MCANEVSRNAHGRGYPSLFARGARFNIAVAEQQAGWFDGKSEWSSFIQRAETQDGTCLAGEYSGLDVVELTTAPYIQAGDAINRHNGLGAIGQRAY